MNEDVAWERGGDDAFGYTGVQPSKPSKLTKMSMLMGDDGVEQYLGCLRWAVFTASVHCSLTSKSFARVSSIASGTENGLGREYPRRHFLSGSPLGSAVSPPAQGGRSRRQQERAEVKAYLFKRPCGCAGPASVVRPDVLVQCDEGREAVLGE